MFRAHSAAAESSAFSLDWKAPASCPPPSFVVDEITRLLGHAPGLVSDRPVSVDATVQSAGSAFIVRILLATPEGRGARTLRDASCERLALASALVVSIAIDPEAVTAQKSAAPSRAATTEAAPLPPPPLKSEMRPRV